MTSARQCFAGYGALEGRCSSKSDHPISGETELVGPGRIQLVIAREYPGKRLRRQAALKRGEDRSIFGRHVVPHQVRVVGRCAEHFIQVRLAIPTATVHPLLDHLGQLSPHLVLTDHTSKRAATTIADGPNLLEERAFFLRMVATVRKALDEIYSCGEEPTVGR